MCIQDGGSNEEVQEALDLCLSCKACKTECPVNVDMATWKAEFLAHHYKGRTHPLHHYALRFYGPLGEVGLVRTELREPAALTLPGPYTGETVAGIAPQRTCLLCSTQFPHRAEQDQRRTQSDQRHGAALAGYLEQLPPAAGARRGSRCYAALDFGSNSRGAISVAEGRSTISVFSIRRART